MRQQGSKHPGRIAWLGERAAQFLRQMFRLPYPGDVTSECGDTESTLPLSPAPPRRFGQLPDLAVSDDFDDPLPETELATWDGRPSREG
ncbi:hypothetical protein NGTWS0302_17120 [Mycolicibacterium cyprinidarum]|jgi:hypothetical protein|uniref:Uncharacterized protein n=3 Tax=Mycolicibacterium TaxID=1866885 RepID=A0A7I7JXD9_9MYCO|nr:hypothetical protein FIV07_14335 [Mycobacterium sp. THAF192]BBX16540.1 hypothetical protein MDUV_14000 [Mycolicibacterium duvalii]GJF17661.1 hypothetical protein NGTWS1702_24430 [Mycolicibacterium sp. NGTWSNA01]GJF18639.1 hypothetical protein NGTWS0302_17120 [Mycolicibacterium sp. NGTWS0302]